MWKQKLTPNLDDNPKNPLYVYQGGKLLTDWYGWCLAVTAASFKAAGGSYSAQTAWDSCATKHQDYDLPEGVWVPVWWTGGPYGHVAEAKRTGSTIVVYSSPYTHKPYFEVFKGNVKTVLDSMAKTYGVSKFAGWSETLLNSRIVEYVKPNLKSNEEIAAEVWAGKWGTGNDRKTRLTEAGYNYEAIQKLVDAGVGKPAPVETKPQEPSETAKGEETMTEPTKPEEPLENGSNEPTGQDSPALTPNVSSDISSGSSQPDSETKIDETVETTGEFVPANPADAQFIGGIIEEASSVFNPSDKVKLIAYLVGDALLLTAILVPDVVNTIQAPTLSVWAEFMSRTLMEAGIFILLIFKLIKKKES